MEADLLLVVQILALDRNAFNACLTREMHEWRYIYPENDDDLPAFDNESFPTRCLASVAVELLDRIFLDPTYFIDNRAEEPRKALYALLLFMLHPTQFDLYWLTHGNHNCVEGVAWDGCRYLARLFISAAALSPRTAVHSEEFIHLLDRFSILIDKTPSEQGAEAKRVPNDES